MTQLELPFFGSRFFAIFVALAPAAVAWWRGRALSRRLDDPTLPERLLAARRGNSAALALSIALLVTLRPKAMLWTVPLLVVARITASYPVRRALFQETWSLGAYLSFFLRLIVAVFGFWILLSASPTLIGLAGPYAWPVAGALAAVLAAWSARHTDIFGRLLRARAIDDPTLVERLARLVEASGIRPPRFERVDMRGGVLANAVALPSRRQSAVVFTETLLSRLDVDEVVAIGAHEIGHLEHYDARRLRRLAIFNNALIGVAALTPAVGYLLPWMAEALPYAWSGLLVLTLVARARNRQHNETEADLRALALTGDPEALVRGLTKLHAIARIPRRWESQFERQATHPSLARRIKAIREAAGAQPATLGEPVTVSSADGSASVVFRDDRLEWNEHALAEHSIKYAHMTELRLDARHPGAPRLLVVDGRGRRWEVPLAEADVARAQAVMDVVDVRTANRAAPRQFPAPLVRVVALVIAATAATMGQLAVVLVALVAAAEPAAPLVAAAGCAALAAAGLAFRDPGWLPGEAMTSHLGIIAGLLATALLWMAAAHRKDTVSSLAWKSVAVLAAGAVMSWVAVLSMGPTAVRLHQAARAWPSTAVFSLSLAAAVAFNRSRRARVGAVAAAMAGLAAVGVGSDMFLEAFSRDALVMAAEPFDVQTISPRRLAEFSVPFDVTGLRLSPSGRTVALLSEGDDEQGTARLGPAGGPFTAFDADEAIFIDDDHVLLLAQHLSTGATLKEAAIGATSSIVYEREIKGIFGAHSFYDTKANTWAVVGQNRDGQIVRVAGVPGNAAVEEQRWTLPTRAAAGISVISASDRDALVMETRYDRGALGAATPLLLSASLLAGGPWTESQLWTIGPHGATSRASTLFTLNCVAGQVGETPAVCAAFDGVRTRLFGVDGGTGLKPIGWLSGRFFLYGPSDSDRAAGWWDNSRVLLRLSTHEALRIASTGEGAIIDIAVGNNMLGVISRSRAATVRLYARP